MLRDKGARFATMSFFGAAACECAVIGSPDLPATPRTARWFSEWMSKLETFTEWLGARQNHLTGGLSERPAPAAEPPPTPVLVVPAEPAPPAIVEDVSPPARRGKWDRSLADRKLWLLKRSGLFGSDARGATFERALTFEDFRKAYRLVHDVYLGTEFITPEPGDLRMRIFETTPEMATFIAKVNGHVVGVLSVVEDSKELGLPSDIAFKDELNALRATGIRVSEITNQAVAEEFRKSAVPTELMRCVVAHLAKTGVDKAIAAVSPSHNAFYELLGFRELGNQRSYSDKLHDPVVALAADVEPYRTPPEGMNETELFVNKFLGSENPYRGHIAGWHEEAIRVFSHAQFLGKLFVQERNLIGECTDAERDILLARWGHDLFSAVFIPSEIKLLEAVIVPKPADTHTNCIPATMADEAVA